MPDRPDPERWAELKRVFLAALDCEGSARDVLLERASRDDPEMRAWVERLLRSDREVGSGSVLETSSSGAPGDERAPDRPLPAIAGYRILQIIGTGGTSTVY